MSSFRKLENIVPRNLFISFLMFSALIVPGFLFLYVTNNFIYFELSFLKLFMLSLALTTPVFMLNLLLSLFVMSRRTEREINYRAINTVLLISSMINILVFYLTIVIGYLIRLNVRGGFLLLVIIEGIVLTATIMYYLTAKPERSAEYESHSAASDDTKDSIINDVKEETNITADNTESLNTNENIVSQSDINYESIHNDNEDEKTAVSLDSDGWKEVSESDLRQNDINDDECGSEEPKIEEIKSDETRSEETKNDELRENKF